MCIGNVIIATLPIQRRNNAPERLYFCRSRVSNHLDIFNVDPHSTTPFEESLEDKVLAGHHAVMIESGAFDHGMFWRGGNG